jgi:hypothetical protein
VVGFVSEVNGAMAVADTVGDMKADIRIESSAER